MIGWGFLGGRLQCLGQRLPLDRAANEYTLRVLGSYVVCMVSVPSLREEGSGTLRISHLFFISHGTRGVTIECEIVILAYMCHANV